MEFPLSIMKFLHWGCLDWGTGPRLLEYITVDSLSFLRLLVYLLNI